MPISAGKATNPILKPESVSSLFVGASTEAGIKNLDLFTISAPTKGNSWSTALAVSSVDAPWGRKKGSAFCDLGLINRLASLKLAKNASQGLDGQGRTSSWTPQQASQPYMALNLPAKQAAAATRIT